MTQETTYQEMPIEDYFDEYSGLFKRTGPINRDQDYPYLLIIANNIGQLDRNALLNAIDQISKRHNITGTIEGIYLEPDIGLDSDSIEIKFDCENDQIAEEYGSELLLAMKDL